jgi:DNA-directed RNA polymerase subunit RPC12/RpoP
MPTNITKESTQHICSACGEDVDDNHVAVYVCLDCYNRMKAEQEQKEGGETKA